MKYKFILTIIIAAATLSSCKKTYTCVCSTVTTASGASGSLITNTKNLAYSQKMTRSQAQAACDHEQQSIQSTETNFFAAGGYTVNANTSCVIQ